MYGTLKDIDVFILCGGIGKRLRKVSGGTPKPMVKIGDYVFLDLLIKYIAGFGFRRFILGTGYRAGIIKDYYSSGRFPGLDIRFSREESPLDTGGAVKNAKELIKSNPFFILNGDSLCKFNPWLFLKFHKQNKSLVSILLRRISSGKEYGEIKIDKFSRILSFHEKNELAKKCLINAGVYIFDKKVFDMMPRQSKFSLEQNFSRRWPVKISLVIHLPGYLLILARPKGILRQRRYF